MSDPEEANSPGAENTEAVQEARVEGANENNIPQLYPSATGYADACEMYWELGWRGVLPLKPGSKYPPPSGFTGAGKPEPTREQLDSWARSATYREGGLCLRLPDGVIGVDVDAYGKKTGTDTLEEAEKRWGRLPPTVRSTSRDDGVSGIRLYKIPPGTKLAGGIKFAELEIGDIDIIQSHHRYLVCAPSIHPEGRPYKWFDEQTGDEVALPPSPGELPELPSAWVEASRADAAHSGTGPKPGAGAGSRSVDRGPSYDVTEAMTAGPPSPKVATRLALGLHELDVGLSRHDTMLAHTLALLRYGKNGEAGVGLALQTLYRAFVEKAGPDRQGGGVEAGAEFERMVSNADRILADPDSTVGAVDGDGSGDAPGPERMPLEDGAELLGEVLRVLRRYVVFPDENAFVAVALWIAATHGVSYWNAAPRLVINSPQKRCGKTRALDVIAGMAHRPLVTVNATAAAIFRSLAGEAPPTLIIDEADTIFGTKRVAEQNEELRALLNAGHQRNRPALRCVGPNREPAEFPTFAMAALAGIGTMPDTITDRAVNITMRRRMAGEQVAQYRIRRDEPILHGLRDRLAVWSLAHAEEMTNAVPDMPVEDRAADTWEPLVAVADIVGGRWPEMARAACVALVAGADDSQEDRSNQIRLLTDIRRTFTRNEVGFFSSVELVQRLKDLTESPWGDWNLTTSRLAHDLAPFGIRPGHNVEKTVRGYRLEYFHDAFQRYTRPEPSDPSDTIGEQH